MLSYLFNETQYWFKARKHFTFIALEQSLDKARDRIRDKDINHGPKTEAEKAPSHSQRQEKGQKKRQTRDSDKTRERDTPETEIRSRMIQNQRQR